MTKLLKALPLALLVSGAVQAATDNPWYVGARVGGTSFSSLDGVIENVDAEKDDWGGGAFIGYNFTPWFALEGGYTYLGQLDFANDGYEVQALDFVGKFTYEVSKEFDIFAKLGAAGYDVDNGVFNEDDTGVSATAGVGLEYYFSNNLSARLEYQYYNQVGDTQLPGETDVHFYGVGLVYHWGAPAPVAVVEPKPEPVVEPEPVPQIVKVPSVGALLPFAFDSNALSQADIEMLQPVAQQLVNYPQTSLYVVGHTDSRGSEAYNQKLSEERALSVAGYVANQFGIDQSRIVVQGKGELEPVAPNDTDAGRAKNRRVEVFVPGFEVEQ